MVNPNAGGGGEGNNNGDNDKGKGKMVFVSHCAHMALCQDCNVIHQRLGMNNCPTCRTPINKRITVRFPPPLTK
nr:putative E3 ubiquitin-protein ligase RF4 [Ipomoea trifida]